MTIQPIKSYKTPAYPTYEESKRDAHLLERLPRRWGKNPIASLLGTGILIQIAGTNSRGDEPVKDVEVKIVEPLEQGRKAIANAVRALPATRVAPILEEALAKDGRGSFGCVAVASPVFLSENEALDLIQAELEKAGLTVQDFVTVDGLSVPDANAQPQWERMGQGGLRPRKIELKNLVEGAYTFDLGTKDKSVVIKFLRMEDFDQWKELSFHGSSVWSVDLSWLASQVSDAFKKRTKGEPVTIGIFFDPIVYDRSYDNDGLDLHGLEWKQRSYVQTQIDAQNPIKDPKARAREKLRQQVLHFVEYLKKEGVAD